MLDRLSSKLTHMVDDVSKPPELHHFTPSIGINPHRSHTAPLKYRIQKPVDKLDQTVYIVMNESGSTILRATGKLKNDLSSSEYV